MASGPWTDEENDRVVADYFAMLADDLAGQPYSKTQHRRALIPRLWNFSREPKAFELAPPLDAHVSLMPTAFQASFREGLVCLAGRPPAISLPVLTFSDS